MVGVIYKAMTSDERPELYFESEASGKDANWSTLLMWDALQRPY